MPRFPAEGLRPVTAKKGRAPPVLQCRDLRPQGAGWRLRLHEKGGKHDETPCHHALAETLRAYITFEKRNFTSAAIPRMTRMRTSRPTRPQPPIIWSVTPPLIISCVAVTSLIIAVRPPTC